jgi:hypothetical protein
MNSVVVKREFGQERRKMTKIPGLVLKTENVICLTESNRMGGRGGKQRCGQDPENETRKIL